MANLNPFRALHFGDRTGLSFLSSETENREKSVLNMLHSAKQDTSPGFYIYEQEFTYLGQRRKVKGFLCLASLREESDFLLHEEIDPETVNQIRAEWNAAGCQTAPVYCMYTDDERKTMSRINLLSSGKPRYEVQENGATHRIWVVNDILVIAAIQEDFAARRLLIADGQSRYEAAREQDGSGFVLTFLADMEQDVSFLPTHCLIAKEERIDETKFLSDCEPYFQVIPRGTVDEIPANLDALFRQGKKAFAFYSGGDSWVLLILKNTADMEELLPEKSLAFRELDTTILHWLILEKLLANPKAEAVFTVDNAFVAVQNSAAAAAFLLNPTRLKEINEITEKEEKMPPNSTAFYPPLPVGLVMYRW